MNTKSLDAVAKSIRSLSMDAIQTAKSGHPGLPLGCAELASVLYGEIMKHNPQDSKWINRDRFVLSAGHGSMLLYSILHLSGYNLTVEDIKKFRQVGSKCPGHPEYGMTDGVDTTSGPLGQGIAMAVGMAIAETMLAAKFNTPNKKIVDHYTYSLMGEGCLMEGISSEASSLAGHLKLGKLIVFYDENKISIDGSTDITFTEDVAKRYEAYGWQVLKGSMYDYAQIASLVEQAKKDERPSFIMLKSQIGKGAPTVAGTAAAHGAPLGSDGCVEAKKNLGLNPDEMFFVDKEAYTYFAERQKEQKKQYDVWVSLFNDWAKENPELKKEWDAYMNGTSFVDIPDLTFKVGDSAATRSTGGSILTLLGERYPNLVGGSADLQGPNVTKIKNTKDYSAESRDGRYIRYGIREFAMAAISNGIQLHGGLRAFCATFLIFSDYARPAMRLSALMKLPVLYVMTHDSIYIGEDGPTHQPVETVSSLRAIPNMQVLRPGDAEEAQAAWTMAINSKDHPVCMVLTRQNVSVYEKADPDWKNTIACGAYVVQTGSDKPDVTVLATGSEVGLALEAAKLSAKKNIRIVSVLDRTLFGKQNDVIKKAIIGNAKRVVTVEAGTKMGWEGFATSAQDIFAIDTFGESGPGDKVAQHLGFTAENLAKLLAK